MATFSDLTVYSYVPVDGVLLNVGWLGADSDFQVGEVPTDVRDTLIQLAMDPVNVMRGLHHCELCDVESPILVARRQARGERAVLGTGEIHVRGAEHTYVAPTLVIHYIDSHHYAPPTEFSEAVRYEAVRRTWADGGIGPS